MDKAKLLGDLVLVDTSRVSIKRLDELEHEYRRLSAALEKATEVSERVGLRQLRVQLIYEGREIVRQLKIPTPPWCGPKN